MRLWPDPCFQKLALDLILSLSLTQGDFWALPFTAIASIFWIGCFCWSKISSALHPASQY
jgi:hypothetical protein